MALHRDLRTSKALETLGGLEKLGCLFTLGGLDKLECPGNVGFVQPWGLETLLGWAHSRPPD